MSRRDKIPKRRFERLPSRDELHLWDAFVHPDERLPHAAINWDSVLDAWEEEHPIALAHHEESSASPIHRPSADQLAKLLGHAPDKREPAIKHDKSGQQVDGNTARRLRRGQLPIEATIDLHGMTRDVAKPALEAFVLDCRRKALRCVLVITGKGRGGDSVLRRELPHWLALPSLSGAVLSYQPARQPDGGEGAFYVLLRRA